MKSSHENKMICTVNINISPESPRIYEHIHSMPKTNSLKLKHDICAKIPRVFFIEFINFYNLVLI